MPTLVATYIASRVNRAVAASAALTTSTRKKVGKLISVGPTGAAHIFATTSVTVSVSTVKITQSVGAAMTLTPTVTRLKLTPSPGTKGVSADTMMIPAMVRAKKMKRTLAVTTSVVPVMARAVTTGGGGYVTPAPNTDPNSFGTVDQTLDPSMNLATLQSKINLAGTGGVVEWAGSGGSHYSVTGALVFKTGQKHFTNSGRIIKCTNTSNMDAMVNLKTTNATNVTISDLEFWGHTAVPSRPTATAPRSIIVPWRGTFLRRVTVKGAGETGLRMQGDRIEDLGIVIDTCDISYHVYQADGGVAAGWKFTELGACGTPVGDVMSIKNTHVHHNWAHGGWWDIGCAGVEVLACEFDNNARSGLFWEVGAGPVYIRDCSMHLNGGAGAIPGNGGGINGLVVISGEKGSIINNTFQSNNSLAIQFLQDTSPASRTSLRCPQIAHAGQHEGYYFEDWDVLGNVLNGNGVNSQVTSNPAINYSTTHVP